MYTYFQTLGSWYQVLDRYSGISHIEKCSLDLQIVVLVGVRKLTLFFIYNICWKSFQPVTTSDHIQMFMLFQAHSDLRYFYIFEWYSIMFLSIITTYKHLFTSVEEEKNGSTLNSSKLKFLLILPYIEKLNRRYIKKFTKELHGHHDMVWWWFWRYAKAANIWTIPPKRSQIPLAWMGCRIEPLCIALKSSVLLQSLELFFGSYIEQLITSEK